MAKLVSCGCLPQINTGVSFAMAERLSKNFLAHEFECSCGCGQGQMDPIHIALLQKLRNAAGPLRVTSGIRCKEHNKLIGGASRSQHIPNSQGMVVACDITYAKGSKSNRNILRLYTLADQLHFKGIGLYKGRIHVDSRPGRRARWIDHFWSWKDT